MTLGEEALRAIVLARGVKATLAAVANLAGGGFSVRGASRLEQASLRGLAHGLEELINDYAEGLAAIDRGNRLRSASG